MDYSSLGSPVQARILECQKKKKILEWVAISFSNACMHAKLLQSWVAISFSRGSSDPGVKTESPALTGGFFTTKPPGKHIYLYFIYSVYVNPNLIYPSPLKYSFKFLNELNINKTWILQLFGLLLFSHWKQVTCQTLLQGKGRSCAGLKRRKIGKEWCRMEM